jgi:hypothetical protein
MKLFFAAAESALPELAAIEAKRILISMANGEKKIPKVPEHFKSGYELIIDSGAFTYQKKKGITLSDWIIKASGLNKYGSELIALDVIGDPASSYENYMAIKRDLPAVLPTFHVGSDITYLDKYLQHTQRIAIGGMVPYKSEIEKLRDFLNEVFSRFDLKTLPKFHAFGYFSQPILENYPWYSADASTWQNYSRFGEFHKFEDLKYSRCKSLRVGNINLRETHIRDLAVYIAEDPLLKLKRIREALNDFEIYLTHLWEKRGIIWQN